MTTVMPSCEVIITDKPWPCFRQVCIRAPDGVLIGPSARVGWRSREHRRTRRTAPRGVRTLPEGIIKSAAELKSG